ncbi:Homoserine O-acetyltransferase [uncultured delta proteobacterium]|uniref:Probable acyltransferase n=1 Tax=uncultured delta proteobacterium TaxID=34034 RepID=A0A212KH24_9DELT|nr:Homoserine O-acetyltransferase [uncultured delta proteobacterium]
MTMLTKKEVFTFEAFTFECGRTIPVRMGYETFGALNAAKDNAILVPHYFSSNSHCAGKYVESDPAAGYWDGLIGPGKAVDTNKYFVISTDNLCNCGVKNPMVHTSGPASIDPETGKPYALSFPVPTIGDIVATQKALLDAMGITRLHAIIGASAGGMIAYEWAVRHPDMMDKVIPVIANPRHPSYGTILVLHAGIRIAMLDPKWNGGNYYDQEEQPVESLRLAVQMMNVAANGAGVYERTYRRNSADVACYNDALAMSSVEKKLYDVIAVNSAPIDLNHWIYTCRMAINHDVSRPYGGDIDAALSRIKAKVLAIPCKHDILHPWEFNAWTVDRIIWLGGSAELYPIDSDYGHMAGILQPHLFDNKVRDFLSR